ncbi:hypothetical protein C0J52_03475 [Blattella germanica]|nr:hypothetical protein C0J52_03475 [Blattella germanica]
MFITCNFVFSDECPNSADDSDEDVITDYLVSREGSGPPMAHKHGGPGPLVPTISVTPHSPGAKHYPVLGNSKEWLLNRNEGDVPRRRSWTALEDLSSSGDKRKSDRQRSMSLSSLDSEQDDPFLDQVDGGGSTGLLATDAGRRTARTGGASTHSLNEADLQSDFNKIVAKREADSLRLLPARLPLQKSVSTPSIIAVRDIANEVAMDGTTPIPP